MKKRERILVLCAHSDDEVISMGGTIAKYSNTRNPVKVVIFSSGEKSIPWLKEKVITKKRISEGEKVGELLGCKIEFLGIPDLKLGEDIKENAKKVQKIIKKFKPDKIFTHNRYDSHPDHRAVFATLETALKNRKRKPKVFTFLIWALFNPRDYAKVYENIDDYFEKKIEALEIFKSQKFFVYLNYLPVFFANRLDGIRNKWRYAETFYVENA